MSVRTKMAQEGWYSEDRITNQGWAGKVGYSIWFKRYDWHGKKAMVLTGSAATYHAHTDDLTKIDDTVRKAAELAKRAYEFIECPPIQVYNDLMIRKPIKVS